MKKPKKESAMAILKAWVSGDYGARCLKWPDPYAPRRSCLKNGHKVLCAFCRARRFSKGKL